MKIDLSKNVFSSEEIKFIMRQLKLALGKGYIKKRHENNIYLKVSYKGIEEKGISHKWNVKIYTYNLDKNGHSLVCVDKLVLKKILEEDYDSFIPPDLQLLRIDDAGWGFPLCGVMVGVSDDKVVKTAVVPVEYFQNNSRNSFRTKKYLSKYTELAIELMVEFGASITTHRIEICTGYVNQPLREKLRRLGYDVRVVEIRGLLQQNLENMYRKYVLDTIGLDIYYDPKALNKSEIPKQYRRCLNYGLRHCPHQIKTGWESLTNITTKLRLKPTRREQ